ncbi:hypothetical protein B0H14DRAFT_2910035, partial [Mycena olivaceomarginata]
MGVWLWGLCTSIMALAPTVVYLAQGLMAGRPMCAANKNCWVVSARAHARCFFAPDGRPTVVDTFDLGHPRMGSLAHFKSFQRGSI